MCKEYYPFVVMGKISGIVPIRLRLWAADSQTAVEAANSRCCTRWLPVYLYDDDGFNLVAQLELPDGELVFDEAVPNEDFDESRWGEFVTEAV